MTTSTPVKVAIFGDSVSTYGGLELTAGADPTLNESYTQSQVGSILSTITALYPANYQIINISRGGMTTDEALTGVQNYVGPGLTNPFGSSLTITQWILDNSPNKIILRYGLADAVLINNSTTTLNNLQTIIDFAVARNIEVILIGVNPAAPDGNPANCGYFPGSMSSAKEITAAAINNGIVNKAIAQGLKYANPRGTLTAPACSLPDGIHPLLNFGVIITNEILKQLRTQVPANEQRSPLPIPSWVTPSGFFFTSSEYVSTSVSLLVIGSDVSFSKISGSLPKGLNISSTGTIYGTPDPVLNTTRSKFVIRAENAGGANDRTFSIDVTGPDYPTWVTPTGYLNVGALGEYYALLNQWVDFTFQANPTQAPLGSNIKYFIADGDGKLPPGLTLSNNGKLTGFIKDQLVPDIDISQDGGYDSEKYDMYSYDHATQYMGDNGIITGSPKIYQFRVTATDGVYTTSRLFKIVVASTDILQYNSTSMPIGIVINSSTNYIQPPQWISGNNLGTIRANNNHYINAQAYDPTPLVGTLTYTISTGTSTFTNLPDGLRLDENQGYLYGFVPYQPAYKLDYTLSINAIKTTAQGAVTVTNTFTLAVKGDVESTIEWVSSSTLGSIDQGMISDVAVIAQQIDSDYGVKYTLTSGSLPNNLILAQDGSLYGRVAYGSTGTYTFTVLASDVYELSAIERTFNLTVNPANSEKYTEIYAKPFLSKEKRDEYYNFVTDKFIFDPTFIYRYYDPNFGIQSEIKLILEFGIEQVNLANYVTALQNNFYRKKIYFGDVKLALAKDNLGNILYEVVYVDAVDNLVNNQNQSVSPVVYANDNIYYPASIDNMRESLEQLVLGDGEYIGINENFTPRFMRTVQEGDYSPPEYMRIIPICYAKPGQGSKIISRIKLSNFDFKKINFEIDRIIVQNSLDNSTAKYLIFERKSIDDTIESDQYLYGAEVNVQLYDENGTPLIRE